VAHVEAYSRLAGVYDEIVIDPCHGRWAAFLHELWRSDPDGSPTFEVRLNGDKISTCPTIARGATSSCTFSLSFSGS